MIKVSLRFLASLLNAEYIVAESVSDDIEITEVTIDTRKVTAGCLFVRAICGLGSPASSGSDSGINRFIG